VIKKTKRIEHYTGALTRLKSEHYTRGSKRLKGVNIIKDDQKD
jgi:hypothetical protein